jgi:hypothetical protein
VPTQAPSLGLSSANKASITFVNTLAGHSVFTPINQPNSTATAPLAAAMATHHTETDSNGAVQAAPSSSPSKSRSLIPACSLNH